MIRRAIAIGAAALTLTAVAAMPAQAYVNTHDWNPGCSMYHGLVARPGTGTYTCISQWETVLKVYGFYSGSTTDGSYGDGVYAGTKRMQQALGFSGGDVDGQVGPKTNAALCGLPNKWGHLDWLDQVTNRNPHPAIYDTKFDVVYAYCF